MKIKLFAIILFMVFVAIPVFAQSENDVNSAAPPPPPEPSMPILPVPEVLEAPEVLEVPVLISESEAMGEQRRAGNSEKSRVLRETAKNKKGQAGQLKSKSANEHRSAVANFVQNLLNVADRQALGGIGEQVREIARQQNASEDKVTPNLEKVKNKNKVRKFLFGTDFKETKEIKKEMQAAQKRLNALERTKDEIDNAGDKAVIEEQIKNFQDNINNVLKEVESEEKRFSLFGWVKKMFI